ncbi:hypothetical protein D3C71_1357840 [compost metagenome]
MRSIICNTEAKFGCISCEIRHESTCLIAHSPGNCQRQRLKPTSRRTFLTAVIIFVYCSRSSSFISNPPHQSTLMKSKFHSLKNNCASWSSWPYIPTPMPFRSLSQIEPQVFFPPSEYNPAFKPLE